MSEIQPSHDSHHPTTVLHEEVNRYLTESIQPYDAWYAERASILREYAALNWIGLSLHLNRYRTSLGNLCSLIHERLQCLVLEMETHKRFQLTVFCSVLAQIDRLWQIFSMDSIPLPEEPTVVDLLRYFKRLA